MSTYTEPTSHVWSVAEQATAANLNTYHAANINATMHFLTRKMASEAVSSSTTLQNDDHLRFPVLANSTWFVWLCMMYNQSLGAALKVAFTFPSGTCTISHTGINSSAFSVREDITSSGTSFTAGATGSGAAYPATNASIFAEGVIDIGSTGGTIQVQWAQNSATGTTTLHPGCSLIAQRINP